MYKYVKYCEMIFVFSSTSRHYGLVSQILSLNNSINIRKSDQNFPLFPPSELDSLEADRPPVKARRVGNQRVGHFPNLPSLRDFPTKKRKNVAHGFFSVEAQQESQRKFLPPPHPEISASNGNTGKLLLGRFFFTRHYYSGEFFGLPWAL